MSYGDDTVDNGLIRIPAPKADEFPYDEFDGYMRNWGSAPDRENVARWGFEKGRASRGPEGSGECDCGLGRDGHVGVHLTGCPATLTSQPMEDFMKLIGNIRLHHDAWTDDDGVCVRECKDLCDALAAYEATLKGPSDE